ncbi:MAG: hypothetical protein QQW96_05205 [Tychonema bourrellyi B0820]|nr:hypothetical protein [Tychonema bourrellyi B0820]
MPVHKRLVENGATSQIQARSDTAMPLDYPKIIKHRPQIVQRRSHSRALYPALCSIDPDRP